jgi:hypothetical protein
MADLRKGNAFFYLELYNVRARARVCVIYNFDVLVDKRS